MNQDTPSTPGDGVIDLFSGAGGWEVALAHSGITGVTGYEQDKWAVATARAAGFHAVHGDLTEVDVRALGRRWGLVGSPPCQAWSRAGRRLGLLDQKRILWILAQIQWHARTHRDTAWDKAMLADQQLNSRFQWSDPGSRLVLEPIRWILATRPRWVALEQVPDVLPFWHAVAQLLRDLGFSTWTGIMDAEQYGVPQTRDRAILLASMDRTMSKPPATHHSYNPRAVADQTDLFDVDLLHWVSMARALGWGMAGRPSIEIEQARDSGPGAERDPRPVDAPSYTIRAGGSGSNPSGTRWVLRSNQITDRPSRPGPPQNTERSVDAPAITITTNARLFEFREISPQVPGITGQAAFDRSEKFGPRPPRAIDEPSFTIMSASRSGGTHRHEWLIEEEDDSQPVRPDWAHGSPATTVQADPRIADSGHKDRAGGERQFTSVSARVTEDEAACLQSFPAGYPWKGGRTAMHAQIGNAIPPLLALAAVGHVTGDPTWQDTCRAAYT